MAEWIRSLNFNHLPSSHGCDWCRFDPALATCETSNVLLADVSSEVENIFISLVAKEQMKNPCFHFTSKLKAISKSYQFSIYCILFPYFLFWVI